MEMNYMKTLSQVMADLRKEGYTHDLRYEDGVIKDENNSEFKADDVTIDQTYRFEGETNPADESILYTVTLPGKQKGFIVNAYGSEANQNINDFINKADDRN